MSLHAEYSGGGVQYGVLFIFSPFYEYSSLEYEHIHIIYKVNQAEYVIRISVAASQKYVNMCLRRELGRRLNCSRLRVTPRDGARFSGRSRRTRWAAMPTTAGSAWVRGDRQSRLGRVHPRRTRGSSSSANSSRVRVLGCSVAYYIACYNAI